MTFYINHTNSTPLATIQDGTTNTTATSITLIGKNFPTYGSLLNQNLVSMLENFSNTTSPNNALIGQLWYDSGNNLLKYYRGGNTASYWQDLPNILFSSTLPSNPQQNDLWWDSTNQQLKFFDQLNWITIGPLTSYDGLNRVSGTNSFIVQIGGNNNFIVDPYGRVSAPYNPVLQLIGATGATTSSGLNSPNTITNTAPSLNTGSCFNTTTGQFTCPIAGIYQVGASLSTIGNPSSPNNQINTTLKWWKNQADSGILASVISENVVTSGGGSVSSKIPLTASGYLQCNAGDTLQCVWVGDQNDQIDNNTVNVSIRLVS